MNDDVRQSWEQFLDPEVVRPRLLTSGLFIAAFEALKDSIITRIQDFFSDGFDQDGIKIGPCYREHVLSLNRSPLHASLQWLLNHDVIDDSDVALFERIKACRNRLAHELFAAVSGKGLPEDFPVLFTGMTSLLKKIETWWIVSVELPTNPDYANQDYDEDGILPGPVMMLQVLTAVALGDEEESRQYLEVFKRELGA